MFWRRTPKWRVEVSTLCRHPPHQAGSLRQAVKRLSISASPCACAYPPISPTLVALGRQGPKPLSGRFCDRRDVQRLRQQSVQGLPTRPTDRAVRLVGWSHVRRHVSASEHHESKHLAATPPRGCVSRGLQCSAPKTLLPRGRHVRHCGGRAWGAPRTPPHEACPQHLCAVAHPPVRLSAGESYHPWG